MIHLELTQDEALLVREILQARWEDMLKEVRHTDHREFREFLRRRTETLEQLLDRLSEPARAGAAARE